LVCHQIDPRGACGTECAWRPVGGDERSARATPAHVSDEAGVLRTFEATEGFEWCQHSKFEARKRRTERVQGDDLAIFVRAHVDNAPTCAAHLVEVAGAYGAWFA
jgi:hypothetical protein